MPLYSYTHDCGHRWNEMRKISERDEPLNNPCPHCGGKENITKDVGAPSLGDPYRMSATQSSKVPGDLKEVMQRIGQQNPGSQLHKRFS